MEKFLVTGLYKLYTQKEFGRNKETILVPAEQSMISDILIARRKKVVNKIYYPLILDANNRLYHVVPLNFDASTNTVSVRVISNLKTNNPSEFWNIDADADTDNTGIDINSSYPYSNVLPNSAFARSGEEYDIHNVDLSKLLQVSYGVMTGRVQYSGPLALLNNQVLTNLYSSRPDDESEFKQLYGMTYDGPVYNKILYKWYQVLYNNYDSF